MNAIHTTENTNAAYQLNWGVTVFWRDAAADEDVWLEPLQTAVEADGVRVLKHRFVDQATSQFFVSTKPHVKPQDLVRVLKGRLQYLIRERAPRALRRNYAVRSIGTARREEIERYIAGQVRHHPMADERVQERLHHYQREYEAVDLSAARQSAHGLYWYNLHVVFANEGRWMETCDEVFTSLLDMAERFASKRGHLVSRIGLLPDHMHLALGCPLGVSPEEVALGYMNNCAYALGMKRVFMPSYYVGTFGEYDRSVV